MNIKQTKRQLNIGQQEELSTVLPHSTTTLTPLTVTDPLCRMEVLVRSWLCPGWLVREKRIGVV